MFNSNKMGKICFDFCIDATVNITRQIPVYLNSYKISLVKPSIYYRPGAPYHFKLAVKAHNGLPLEQGKMVKVLADDKEITAPLDSQGMASFVISTPDEIESIYVSVSLRYDQPM